QINFVDGGSKQASQSGHGTDWRTQMNKLLPITLNELRIDNGRITFNNFNSTPKVKIEPDQVNASINNLPNVVDVEGNRDAE
ncbi:hypothetical protein RA276_30225, partial [Pseudomonas syringae pv. tagetis]